MNKSAKKIVNNFYTKPLKQTIRKVSEKNLEELPGLIKNYLKKINIIGTNIIHRVRLIQEGSFKLSQSSKWKTFQAEQYINTQNLSFLWYAKIRMIALINAHVIDKYTQGKGGLNVKLLNLIPIIDKEGNEFNQGEFLRFLSETPWYPTFYLNQKIKWNEIDNNTLNMKLNNDNLIISGNVLFDESGLIKEFTAERYYSNPDNNKITLEDWHGYCYDYEEKNGILIPTKFKVCWDLDDGEYSYIRGKIKKIEFNNSKLF
jgi:hypothetical protein